MAVATPVIQIGVTDRQRLALIGASAIFAAVALPGAGLGGPPPARVSAAPQVTIAHAPPRPPVAVVSAAPAPEIAPLRRFTAPVGEDLSESLRKAGVQEGLAREYVDQMLRVERFVSEISVADRFDLVVLQSASEQPVLVYAGMDRVGRGDLQFLKYGDGHGRVEWVDARGLERRESAGMTLPVGGRVTSAFGRRMHPLLGVTRFHKGIDLAAAAGTPIRAAADGRVVSAGWHGGYGRQVALAHDGGLATSYSHMSRILARPGEAVKRGDIIGLVGSSGLSTGPHVHFEATRGGRPIDPRSATIDLPVPMNAAQRHAFLGELRTVLTLAGAQQHGTS